MTVAQQLGGTPHISPLLRKARRLGLNSPDSLLRLAVKRGCTHYTPPDFDPAAVSDAGVERLSDAELAIALISAAQEFHPLRVRCAAQLLGSPSVTPEAASRLAAMEGCEPVLAWIAGAGLELDAPERREHWSKMLARLHPRVQPRPGGLPHASRFTVQTGVMGPRRPHARYSVWLRPINPRSNER